MLAVIMSKTNQMLPECKQSLAVVLVLCNISEWVGVGTCECMYSQMKKH